MAIVKFTAPVSDLRGKLGGLVYKANASGPCVMAWRMPRYQRTVWQNLYRARFSTLAISWRALSGAQRAAWSAWAAAPAQARVNALGETYYLTGWQAYCSISANLLMYSLALRTTPPTLAKPAAPTISSFVAYASASASHTTITCASGTWTGYYGKVNIAIVPSIGIADNAPFFKYTSGIGINTSNVTDIDFGLNWRFGFWQVNQRMLLRLSRMNAHGYEGSFATAQANVQA